jgi:hypothetical protein
MSCAESVVEKVARTENGVQSDNAVVNDRRNSKARPAKPLEQEIRRSVIQLADKNKIFSRCDL